MVEGFSIPITEGRRLDICAGIQAQLILEDTSELDMRLFMDAIECQENALLVQTNELFWRTRS